MMHQLIEILDGYPEYRRLERSVSRDREGTVSVFGLGEAARAHMAAALFLRTNRTVLYVAASEAAAERAREDISVYTEEDAVHFPARELPFTALDGFAASAGLTARRIAILEGLLSNKPMFITVSASALLQRLAPPEVLKNAVIKLKCGEEHSPQKVIEKLLSMAYERADVTEAPGQFSRRGGYLDIFPMTSAHPVRIEFFGDEIDTIRLYDPETQRSVDNTDEISISPATEAPVTDAARLRAVRLLTKKKVFAEQCESLLGGIVTNASPLLLPYLYDGEPALQDYIPDNAIILIDEPSRVEESAKAAYTEFCDTMGAALVDKYAEADQAGLMDAPTVGIERLDTPGTAMLFALTRTYGLIAPKRLFRFDTRAATLYLQNEQQLRDDLVTWRSAGTTVVICAGSHAQRLADRLLDMDMIVPVVSRLDRAVIPGEHIITGNTLSKGFEYPEMKLIVITENELYGQMSKRSATGRKKRPQLVFTELQPGDLVVHELHGIGRFSGVVTMEAAGVVRDYLHIVYAAGEKLYIPTDQLDRVQKFVGSGEEAPKLSKLGSGEWQKTVSRTRESVKKLAFDLVKLYGERRSRKGFAFSEDNQWQKQLETSFPYQETPDQLTSIAEIKRDMESDRVMDRLLCGDVGYGKTEVALRAAFKCVMDSKQAALLVPTTILAQQHYSTLSARFAGFPVRVGLLSRFVTDAEEKKILAQIESGDVDVIVGTHKLLSKSVKFHDLGLLIVDEEQRFGVGHKEQIKVLRKNVDVLTLSATPIPRTLHMSMTGIRDMSVIETPPELRYPVQTYVMEYSDQLAREAILKEIGRGGQVYFVYNRVKNMENFMDRLQRLVPEARIAMSHGQMGERLLEKTMLDFLDHQYDVLLCSTIIESGLDIPSVNSIIVYDADNMGLSQLYQLRGRVGRGTRLGYAYLTFKRDKVLTEIAEKRLSAIREFTQFGSGFKIAMRDLEIRGAGNLLGPEQSGHMTAVGYELYCRIVDEAVKEAKGETVEKKREAVVEAPVSANIPENYIRRAPDRLGMYKRIATIGTPEDYRDITDELIDRFGEPPKLTKALLDIALLKASAEAAYISHVRVRDGEVKLTFEKDAPINAMALMNLLSRTGDARMMSGDAPFIIVRRPRDTAERLVETLPQFVYTICDCIERK